MVNRIFSCDYVFIDGIRYSRSGNVVPICKDSDTEEARSVFTIQIREARFLNPEIEHIIRLYLRRTPNNIRKSGQILRRVP